MASGRIINVAAAAVFIPSSAAATLSEYDFEVNVKTIHYYLPGGTGDTAAIHTTTTTTEKSTVCLA